MPENRRLAAVMFSDICGYTTMMGEDESTALAMLKRNIELHRKIIEEYNGHYVKDIGDGILAWFDSATNAVECALKILRASANEDFELRFGIHEGDIIIQPSDILGSGVNIASRIESAAIPGSILFSSKVYDSLKSQAHLTSIRIDKFKLKNDHIPRDLYALAVSPCNVPMPAQVRAKRHQPNKLTAWLNPSVIMLIVAIGLTSLWFSNRRNHDQPEPTREIVLAILPFQSSEATIPGQTTPMGIAAGIGERMSLISGLITISASESAQSQKFIEQASVTGPLGIDKVVSDVNATHLIRGIVDQELTIELLEAEDQKRLWKGTFALDDPLKIIESVTRNVARELGISRGQAKYSYGGSINDAAIPLYLEALRRWHDRSVDSNLMIAIDLLESARIKEPENPNVMGLLALCYAAGTERQKFSFSDSDSLIFNYADKTLEIDPNHPHGLLALGTYYSLSWDYQLAEEYYQRAFDRAPDKGLTSQALGELLLRTGRYKQAYNYFERAAKAAPRDHIVLNFTALAEMANGYPNTAYEIFEMIDDNYGNITDYAYHREYDLLIEQEYDDALALLSEHDTTPYTLLLEGIVYVEKRDKESYMSYLQFIDSASYVGRHVHLIWNLHNGNDSDKIRARENYAEMMNTHTFGLTNPLQTYPLLSFNSFRTDSEIQEISMRYGIKYEAHPYFKMLKEFQQRK